MPRPRPRSRATRSTRQTPASSTAPSITGTSTRYSIHIPPTNTDTDTNIHTPTIPRPLGPRFPAIDLEVLSQCKRDRDYTCLLDLKHDHHAPFIRNLKRHVEFFHTWAEIRTSEGSRELCVDQFLDIYGGEYWGVASRGKYIMGDSVARGDEVRWPDDCSEMKQVLVLLLKKKADGMAKDRGTAGSETTQPTPPQPRTPPATAPEIEVQEETEYVSSTHQTEVGESDHQETGNEDTGEDSEEEPHRPSTSRRKRHSCLIPESLTPTASAQDNETSSSTSLSGELTSAGSVCSEANTAITTHVPTGPNESVSDVFDSTSAKALHAKYRRATYFLVTTSDAHTAPAWTTYETFTTASSFLLHVGREYGLEQQWWTRKAQTELEGADKCQAENLAQEVISMASIKLEWSGDEVLVRWGNDGDWGIVMQMVQKAWLLKDLGLKAFDTFRVRVMLHLRD
ncbi:uncharacterized protein BDV14DRAFT_197557 [Aspergillus stella-maris]|uniref:uncharacterized protein n=1 Tax=Aspergillus stella-maris TaxID=1810926 RepID=UPI003CCCB05D